MFQVLNANAETIVILDNFRVAVQIARNWSTSGQEICTVVTSDYDLLVMLLPPAC